MGVTHGIFDYFASIDKNRILGPTGRKPLDVAHSLEVLQHTVQVAHYDFEIKCNPRKKSEAFFSGQLCRYAED
jgi:hypothetical protein